MDKKKPNDLLVRRSLWEVYKRRCFYCKESVPFDNRLEIDHLIPKSLGNEKAIEKYGLSEDFELDSYYNLVPSCSRCNNRKRARELPKNQIFLFLDEIGSRIPTIMNLEEKFKKEDIESSVSSVVSMALEKVNVNDILITIKDQNLTTYQQKVLEETIDKLSRVDIGDVIDLLKHNKLAEQGLALSVLSVIEPISYNMSDGIIFYKDFTIAFWSTSKSFRNHLVSILKEVLEDITHKNVALFNIDTFVQKQKELAQENLSSLTVFFKILEVFIWIIFITSQMSEGIFMQPFTVSSKEKEDFYWFYVGTRSLEPESIRKIADEKREYWAEHSGPDLKNSFLILVNEI